MVDNDGEVRELTKDDFKLFKPAAEVLPKELVKVLPKRGRPVSDSPKKPIQIRLSPEIVSAFKATGRGWQTRINDALRDWLKEPARVDEYIQRRASNPPSFKRPGFG